MDGRKPLDDGDQIPNLKVVWILHLEDVFYLCFCDISVVILVNFIDSRHHLVKDYLWLLLDDFQELLLIDGRLLLD